MNGLEERTLFLLRSVLGDDIEIIAQAGHLPGTPDFLVESLRLICFCDGSLWHNNGGRMSRVGIRQLARGKASGGFWLHKAQENARRDRRVSAELRRLGFVVVRLKEHRLRSHNALAYVSRTIGRALLVQQTAG